MTKKEIENKILKEALTYLKYRKAYDENPCETEDDDVNHMMEEDKYLTALSNMEELYDELEKLEK